MQIVSTTGSTAKAKTAKANGKGGSRKRSDAKDTLHLKGKQLSATQRLADADGMIATAAYYLAERRGFEPGHEIEDWLTAEQQVRSLQS
jgi:hypothetical protein